MKIKNLQILNREGKIPDDGWYQIVPLGEFPVSAEGPQGQRIKLSQVIDEKAVTSMAAGFQADGELLVDYDHASLDEDKPSEAAGWIREVEARSDGLYAKIEWTDTGSAAVTNKRYRYVSPVWNRNECEEVGKNRVRPLRMDSLALTNVPNLKGMRPLSNRGTVDEPQNIRAGEQQMKELITLLGLAVDATDQMVVDAVKALKTSADEAPALKNRAETAEGKLQAAETKQLEIDADAFCGKFAKHITNRDQVRGQFIANRAGTEALFAGLKLDVAAEPSTALKNRATGNPDDKGGQGDDAAAAKIRNRATEIMNQRKCSWGVAFDAAQSESKK